MDSSTLVDRLPPQDQDAEQATLGAMLTERDAIARVVSILQPSDFYGQVHRTLFEAITALFDRGEPVDVVTLSTHLRDQGKLDEVGGMSYLMALLDAVPTAANVERYARTVRAKATLRGLIAAASQITAVAHDGTRNVDEAVDECERLVFAVGERTVGQAFVPLKTLIAESYDRIEKISQVHEPGTGLHTGFPELDQLTSGFQRSDLVILAARPSMGKTALALNIATHVALREDFPVAVFSLEMARDALAMRILCAEARVNQQNVRLGFVEEDDLHRLARASELLYNAPVYIDDTASMSVLEMRGKARRLDAELGGLGLLIVDYLQLMHGHGRYENRTQEISQIARGLKSLARELRVPVLALSQLSRAVEMRPVKRPMLSDLRESGSIEAEADVVMFIYRPAYYGPDEMERADYPRDETTLTELIVAKQRNGPTDKVMLAWVGSHIRFERREASREVAPED
jgi:replicative DNA helicase